MAESIFGLSASNRTEPMLMKMDRANDAVDSHPNAAKNESMRSGGFCNARVMNASPASEDPQETGHSSPRENGSELVHKKVACGRTGNLSFKNMVTSPRFDAGPIGRLANGEKKRNFVETIELHIGLKNYNAWRDKRFSEITLPNVPRLRMSICILADAHEIDHAEKIELKYIDDDLKTFVYRFTMCSVSG
ncbi:hypothetical protein K439DRAFT_1556765 [Ramaria rubella]|nr:hypothetical protein K439DRAFT_1556765 [Ramaria rubella]